MTDAYTTLRLQGLQKALEQASGELEALGKREADAIDRIREIVMDLQPVYHDRDLRSAMDSVRDMLSDITFDKRTELEREIYRLEEAIADAEES